MILIICRSGEMLVVVGILVKFRGNMYYWCIRVRRPILGLLYGCPWICRVWMVGFILLNIILYYRNNLYRYLVDLNDMSLVSWMAIMDGGVDLFVSDWSPSNVVLNVPQFHDSILVAGFVHGVFWGFMGGWFCMGLECIKFGISCRHFKASSVIFSRR